ncbi:spore coat protein [Halobacillus amylolyticus]|uniref:Spore coat protein n=1 Tax=Halobacillus amylolyticus TaxID=2932259 RepID=A0ABY4HGM0_9BACI|nr:spore coat protein [Halobacillus amylolyticus]UOR13926.1 spore coat protein [Halobacillus amylolyticus]
MYQNDTCYKDKYYNTCNTCKKDKEKCPCPKKPYEWNALDPTSDHPFGNTIDQDANAQLKNIQQSFESIVIKDSCDINVSTSDTQVAVNIQVAIQAAIALIVSISIADSEKANTITQDLNSQLKSSQVNRQQTYIENSRGVTVTTDDSDVAVNVQVALQVLVALVIRLGIL